jgi:hypothetical protein
MPVSISGNTGITFPDGSLQTAAASPLVLRNRIINGDMRIDQRNAGASVTPTANQYITDRWQVDLSQASKFTAQQSTTAPTGFSNSLLITSSSAYSVGSGDYFYIRQKIEGFNTSDLAFGTANAKTVTLSFWVYSSLTGTFGGSLRNSAVNRSYPFSYTISSANTWTQISVTIAGDTTGTWIGSTNGIGIDVAFSLGTGTTYSGTAGSWAATNYVSVTGATSVVGTNGATFYITGVQLEQNTSATPFERRLISQELANCQRYYQHINPTDTQYVSAGRWGGNAIGFSIPTIVSLRVSPTIGSAGTFVVIGNAVTENFTSPAIGSWSGSLVTLIKTGLTNNPSTTQAYVINLPGTGTNYFSFSSEL